MFSCSPVTDEKLTSVAVEPSTPEFKCRQTGISWPSRLVRPRYWIFFSFYHRILLFKLTPGGKDVPNWIYNSRRVSVSAIAQTTRKSFLLRPVRNIKPVMSMPARDTARCSVCFSFTHNGRLMAVVWGCSKCNGRAGNSKQSPNLIACTQTHIVVNQVLSDIGFYLSINQSGKLPI